MLKQQPNTRVSIQTILFYIQYADMIIAQGVTFLLHAC